MPRTAIIGPSGSGKTALARRLAAGGATVYDNTRWVPNLHRTLGLDRKPDWVVTARAEADLPRELRNLVQVFYIFHNGQFIITSDGSEK